MISGSTLTLLLGDVAGGLDDGRGLHDDQLGIGDGQAAAAMAQHGVHLVQLLHALLNDLHRHAHAAGHFVLARVASWGRNSCRGGSSRRMVTG
jgi:hypothetical protein